MSSTTLVCLSIFCASTGLIDVFRSADRRLEFVILADSVSQLSTQVDLLKKAVLSVEDLKRADTIGAIKLVPRAAEATSFLPWIAAASVLGLSLAWWVRSLGVSAFSELTLASGTEVGAPGVVVAKAGSSRRILGRAQMVPESSLMLRELLTIVVAALVVLESMNCILGCSNIPDGWSSAWLSCVCTLCGGHVARVTYSCLDRGGRVCYLHSGRRHLHRAAGCEQLGFGRASFLSGRWWTALWSWS